MTDTWPLRDVAPAADMNLRALRQWLETSVITLQGNDKKASGSGNHWGLSRQRAYQVAIVQRLNKLGVFVSRAAAAALVFSDEGQTGRAPGELFSQGRTTLVVSAEGTKVVNTMFDAAHTEVTNRAVTAITVDCNDVVGFVDSVLTNESAK
jgi:hypothetical protein